MPPRVSVSTSERQRSGGRRPLFPQSGHPALIRALGSCLARRGHRPPDRCLARHALTLRVERSSALSVAGPRPGRARGERARDGPRRRVRHGWRTEPRSRARPGRGWAPKSVHWAPNCCEDPKKGASRAVLLEWRAIHCHASHRSHDRTQSRPPAHRRPDRAAGLAQGVSLTTTPSASVWKKSSASSKTPISGTTPSAPRTWAASVPSWTARSTASAT